jgi:hypothetical protein
VASGTASVPFTAALSGLTGKTVYHYRAVATNVANTVYGSDMSFTTLPAPTIGTLAVSVHDATGIVLSGAITGNGVATTYYIQYGTTTAYGSQTSGVVVPSSTAAIATLSGLQPGTTYYYRVVTVSAAGTFYGSTGSFTTANVELSTIFSRGSSAPGVPNGEFASFGYPVINNSDNVAFQATLMTGYGGVTSSTETGIWAANSSGSITLVARQGEAAPGTAMTVTSGRTTTTATATFASFSDPVYNDNGQVAFSATFNAGTAVPAGTATAIWSNASGPLSLVARLGESAPGGGKFTAFNGLALPDQGGVLLLATTGSGTTGVWEGTTASNLQMLTYTGETLNGKTVTGVALLPAGEVQTRSFTQAGASVACLVTFSDHSTAILSLVGDDLSIVAQSSAAAPGTNNVAFTTFSNPVINANNHVAYAATLANHATGIWADNANGVSGLTALSGTTAPGTSSTFSTFSDPVDNGSDIVAFMATLANHATGIWAGSQAAPQLVALSGAQAPGCASGVTYSTFKALGLPDQGGVVFTATLAGTGVTSANNSAIFAGDDEGNLTMIMRSGDSFNGKTVSALYCLPTESAVVSGQTRSFVQDVGDLVYLVTYSDGTTSLVKVVFP